MSERKYTDENIIKALECCADCDCENCPRWSEEWYNGSCDDLLPTALDLINRKNAEIDKLQEVNADLNESLRLAAEANKDLKAEIERLREYYKKYHDLMREIKELQDEVEHAKDRLSLFDEAITAAKAEAIKDFAERVINLIYSADDINPITEWQIDNLVEEMTEGE